VDPSRKTDNTAPPTERVARRDAGLLRLAEPAIAAGVDLIDSLIPTAADAENSFNDLGYVFEAEQRRASSKLKRRSQPLQRSQLTEIAITPEFRKVEK
jgi:hypothetical protein